MTFLEAVTRSSRLFHEAGVIDLSIIVTDAEAKVVAFLPSSKTKSTVKVGDVLSAGFVTQCINERKKIESIIPEEVYGVRIKGNYIPIIEEDGRVSGVLGTTTSTEKEDALKNIAHTIASTAQQLSATAEEMAGSASQLAADMAKIKLRGESVLAEIAKTSNILKIVSNLASNSNLLGLNSAIEAARAGEYGRGFAVVADEIRKMASDSTQSVNDIRRILEAISSEAQAVVATIVSTAECSERQAAGAEEIAACINDLAFSATEVGRISEKV